MRVYLDGTPIGTAQQSPQGALSFTYDDDYRDDADATPLSLSMPLAGDKHGNKAVRAYLDGLLPDNEGVRERWARQYNVSANSPFGLLQHMGRDAAGAVQMLPPDVDPTDALERTGQIDWLSDEAFAKMTRELAEHDSDWDPGRYGGRWSLAGAQPKIALFHDPDTDRWGIPMDSTPTTAIVKPAITGYSRHHVNEALCLTAASEAGLLAARVSLLEIEGVRAVVSHRYDRRRNEEGQWVRVHQEDFCQALAVHPSMKYQSDGGPGVAQIGDLIASLAFEDREISLERFLKGLAFNVLIGGTDAHAKNYSLILIGPRAQVAPLYDIASAACYPQYRRLLNPMRIATKWKMLDVVDEDWAKVGRRLGIPGDRAVGWVAELRSALPGAFAEAVNRLPQDTRAEAGRMAERILEHVDGSWRPELTRDPTYLLEVEPRTGSRK